MEDFKYFWAHKQGAGLGAVVFVLGPGGVGEVSRSAVRKVLGLGRSVSKHSVAFQ